MKTGFCITILVLLIGRISATTSSFEEEITNPEVLDENSNITKEQVLNWSREFFRTAKSSFKSILQELEISDPASRSERRFHPSSNEPLMSGSNSNNARARMNNRHYDFPLSSNSLPNDNNSHLVKVENLEWMLQKIFVYPRSHVTNETAKEIIRNYITDSFQSTSGLHTSVQHFKPLQFLQMYEGQSLPTGANVIAVLKGAEWGTENDRPIVIGAHWDTVNFTPGTDDNGSGVASMLEAARAISHSGCRPKYSIIFVAFDLEEVGSQGSLIFIKDYLVKILQTMSNEIPTNKFQGAFIMDTIMNFNQSEGSQTFPTDWSLVLPDVYEDVANENYVGDFLSMIYRREVDFQMAEKFQTNWIKSTHEAKYKIKAFPLILKEDLPDLETLSDHLNFLRSDHARFWFMNDTEVPFTFKAVLMTDTGPYRGSMRACYHTVCDGPEVALSNPHNLKFLAKITQVLVDTTMEMSECKPEVKKTVTSPNEYRNFEAANNNAPRGVKSPLENLIDFVRWIQN